ncbi:MAG: hypothetical protein WCG87_08085 [Bacteroidota bacterium]
MLPLLFFIIVKVLVYYFKDQKEEPVFQINQHDIFERPFGNLNTVYKEDVKSPFVFDKIVDVEVKNARTRIKYIVNGKEILCDLQRYYYVKLGLPLPIMRIDRDVISRAYEIKLASELEGNSDLDIVAAGYFFEHRIAYLNLN